MAVISTFFLLVNTIFTMYLGGFRSLLEKEIPTANCDNDITYQKKDAYTDMLKSYGPDGDKSNGIMACYCRQETTLWALWVLIPHNF